jgi:hypothetical protein
VLKKLIIVNILNTVVNKIANCSDINLHHSEFLKPYLPQVLLYHVHLMLSGNTFYDGQACFSQIILICSELNFKGERALLTLPQLRWLVALSSPWSHSVGSVVDKVALVQVFLCSFHLSPASYSLNAVYSSSLREWYSRSMLGHSTKVLGYTPFL